MQANVAPYSQTEKLWEAVAAAGVRHGETVRADVHGFQVVGAAQSRPEVRFCHIRPLTLRSRIGEGDDRPIPLRARGRARCRAGRRLPHRERPHQDERPDLGHGGCGVQGGVRGRGLNATGREVCERRMRNRPPLLLCNHKPCGFVKWAVML